MTDIATVPGLTPAEALALALAALSLHTADDPPRSDRAALVPPSAREIAPPGRRPAVPAPRARRGRPSTAADPP